MFVAHRSLSSVEKLSEAPRASLIKKVGLQNMFSASYSEKIMKPRKLTLQGKGQVMNTVEVETC